jgi:hypothetical protein
MTLTDTQHDVASRHDQIENVVERLLKKYIAAEHKRSWPNQEKRDDYYEAFKVFVGWCRENDLDPMPASGHVAAMHLIALKESGANYPQIRLAAAAVAFFHDVNDRFLDRLPIRAALAFAKEA